MTDGVVFNGSSLIGSTVSIPLKTNADATTFSFILNSGSTNPALSILKFNYARENFCISSVWFKTEYTLDPRTPYVLTDAARDQMDSSLKQFIANENETHLEIYFLFSFYVLAQAQVYCKKNSWYDC
jgi:hypothetical protein